MKEIFKSLCVCLCSCTKTHHWTSKSLLFAVVFSNTHFLQIMFYTWAMGLLLLPAVMSPDFQCECALLLSRGMAHWSHWKQGNTSNTTAGYYTKYYWSILFNHLNCIEDELTIQLWFDKSCIVHRYDGFIIINIFSLKFKVCFFSYIIYDWEICFTHTASDGVRLHVPVRVSLVLYRADRNKPCVYDQVNKLACDTFLQSPSLFVTATKLLVCWCTYYANQLNT